MAREFTDGMHQLAADADVADLKATMDKAKGGNLDDLANAIDPGGSVSEQVRELGDTVKATADDDDVNVMATWLIRPVSRSRQNTRYRR